MMRYHDQMQQSTIESYVNETESHCSKNPGSEKSSWPKLDVSASDRNFSKNNPEKVEYHGKYK